MEMYVHMIHTKCVYFLFFRKTEREGEIEREREREERLRETEQGK